MAATLGMACTLLGAAAIYLASPNQLLTEMAMPRRPLVWGGTAASMLGLALLFQWAGPATAVFIHVTLTMLVWSLVPITIAWIKGDRKPVR